MRMTADVTVVPATVARAVASSGMTRPVMRHAPRAKPAVETPPAMRRFRFRGVTLVSFFWRVQSPSLQWATGTAPF